MGVKGEENAGLTVSFLYFAMNKNASEKDQKATKQFLDYILNDDEARDIITNEAGFETPFKSYAKAERGRFSCAGECTVKSGRGFPEIFPGTGSGLSSL